MCQLGEERMSDSFIEEKIVISFAFFLSIEKSPTELTHSFFSLFVELQLNSRNDKQNGSAMFSKHSIDVMID